jgi:hypothetical protein
MKITVIGELCTDVFVYGDTLRLSPEAPVPVLTPTFTEENPDFGRFGKYTLPLNKFGKWLDSWGEFRYGQKPDQCKAGAAKGLTFNRPTDETFDF